MSSSLVVRSGGCISSHWLGDVQLGVPLANKFSARKRGKTVTRISSAFTRGPALVTFVNGGDGPTVAILANFCGRGDKDIFTVAERLGVGL